MATAIPSSVTNMRSHMEGNNESCYDKTMGPSITTKVFLHLKDLFFFCTAQWRLSTDDNSLPRCSSASGHVWMASFAMFFSLAKPALWAAGDAFQTVPLFATQYDPTSLHLYQCIDISILNCEHASLLCPQPHPTLLPCPGSCHNKPPDQLPSPVH